MKKNEALELSRHRVNLIIEYIESILQDDKRVFGEMIFNSTKINNESMCILDIFVPISNFEKHINLGITTNHCDILYETLFDELLNKFLEHEFLGVTRYTKINYMMGPSFSGVIAVNSLTGSKLKINFLSSGKNFNTITTNYNQRINLYTEKQNNNESSNHHYRK